MACVVLKSKIQVLFCKIIRFTYYGVKYKLLSPRPAPAPDVLYHSVFGDKKDEDTPRTPNTQSVNGRQVSHVSSMTAAFIAAARSSSTGAPRRAGRARKVHAKAGSRAPWPEVGAKIQRVVGKIEREPAARLVRREQPRLGRRAAHEA